MKVSGKFFLVIVIFLISFTAAIHSGTSLAYKVFYPQKDAFIDSRYTRTNFGTHDYLICGNVEGEGEKWIFIFFDFSSVMRGWQEVYLYLNYEQGNLNSNSIDIYALNLTYWNEERITWENKPNLGVKLTSVSLRPFEQFLVRVDTFIFRPIFSICLKFNTKTNGFFNIFSNEHDDIDLRPHLMFNYEDTGPQKFYGLIGIIISFGILGLTLSVIYSHYTSQRKNNKPIDKASGTV